MHRKLKSKSLKMEEGWFSKDDMQKILQWNANLAGIIFTISRHLRKVPACSFESSRNPRKKIEGAIRVCNADSARLVRTGSSCKPYLRVSPFIAVDVMCRKSRYGGDDEL